MSPKYTARGSLLLVVTCSGVTSPMDIVLPIVATNMAALLIIGTLAFGGSGGPRGLAYVEAPAARSMMGSPAALPGSSSGSAPADIAISSTGSSSSGSSSLAGVESSTLTPPVTAFGPSLWHDGPLAPSAGNANKSAGNSGSSGDGPSLWERSDGGPFGSTLFREDSAFPAAGYGNNAGADVLRKRLFGDAAFFPHGQTPQHSSAARFF